ncbi:MAG TPA: hypothetical protein VE684_20675 [Crenalkalicoccus sp.]|nr:hypothetical protein [Crenalkalicoccus sp.]
MNAEGIAVPRAPLMDREEFDAALVALDRSQRWIARKLGTHRAAIEYWFSEGGPGVPPSVAAWLRRQVRHAEADPPPDPMEWRRDLRGTLARARGAAGPAKARR